MFRINLGTNTSRQTVNVNPNSLIREVLEAYNVNYANTTLHLDGIPLTAMELNRSFNDLGVTDNSYLIAVIKCENA